MTRQARQFHLPSHAVLRSFEAAARHESFTLAARELHLTQSAISRQVRELEQIVGTALFRRVGRRVVVTEAGRNLAGEIAEDLERIRQTLFRAMTSGDQRRSLRIAVLPTFASRWLIPRLPDFARRHPSIGINLGARLKPFDLTADRFDLAIHFGSADWPDTKMVHLCDEEMIAVASPQFRNNHDATKASALRDVPLLHLETRPTAWNNWFSSVGITGPDALPGQLFDQFSMIIAAAVSSLGAALLPAYLIERELREGTLVQLHETALKTANSYYVVTPIGAPNPDTEAFTQWIRNAATTSFIS